MILYESHYDRSGEIDWREITQGESLTKFIAVDESQADYSVEVHGFFDSQGRFHITDEKIIPRTQNSPGNPGEEKKGRR